MRKILYVFFAVILLFSFSQAGKCQELYTLKTAWLAEHEAFAAWYGKKQGWDVEAGFKMELRIYPTGKLLMHDMQGAPWEIAACGALPAMTEALFNKVEIIAIGNDESLATGVYTRKSSPMLGHTGYNALFPEMAGTANTVRGKTILCPLNSSAEYTVFKWLKALGLTEKDVVLKDMPPEKALSAFLAGEGDAVALWSPFTLEAESNGLAAVTLSNQCDASQPTLVVAAKAFAQQYPERVQAFLKVYFRGITALQETPREKLMQLYAEFFTELTGKHMSPQAASWELARHPVYSLGGQKMLFAGQDSRLRTWLKDLTAFAGGENRLGDVTDRHLLGLDK